jgi:hypothetical protein
VRRAIILLLVTAAGSISCVDVDGGAVEASWVLRTFDGRGISDCSCSSPEVSRIRFVLARVGPDGAIGPDACAGRDECEFSCGRKSGATPLDIPPGLYAVSVTAADASGRDLTQAPVGMGGVGVPAPILQEVLFGRPAQVAALRIETDCAAVCDGGDKSKVCSRD